MTASVACSSGHAARVVARVVSRRPPSPNPLAPTLLAVEPVGDADAEERLLGNIRRHVRGFDREDDARALLREYLRFMTIKKNTFKTIALRPSAVVGEAWRQHALNGTRDYVSFCDRVFGDVLDHANEDSAGVNANDAAEMEAYARVLAKYREAFREDPPARAWPAIARNEEDMEEDLEEEARRGRLVVRVVPKNEQSGSASGASDGEKLSDELTSAMEGDAAMTGAPREARRLPGESDATFELRKKAEGGDADAQCKLGVEHYGAERYEEALKLYRQAAEKGHAAAQNGLGNCYCDGHGVEKNLVEAVKLYRQAAEHGRAEAQHDLGGRYYFGEGEEKNHVEAVKWYRQAAENGHAGAQYVLGGCYEHGEGVEKNMAEAVKWFHQAAEQGDADAQYDLGRCYYFSYGHCGRDLGKAEHWLAKAVENGYKRSEGLLKEVRELMNLEVAAAEKKAAAAAKKAAAAEKRKAAAAAKTAAKRAKR